MFDLRKLNSITKYPSIPTYHTIEGKGNLKPILTEGVNFDGQAVEYTEKVDGENTRTVFVIENGDVDYFIGSREELLYAKGDRILNPLGNIVESLKTIAERVAKMLRFNDGVFVVYQEIFGGKTLNSKQYTNSRSVDVRAFDMFYLPMEKVNELMSMPLEKIASWRDHGGQPYFTIDRRSLS